MNKLWYAATSIAFGCGAALAQVVPDVGPVSLQEIAERQAAPLTREEVLRLVSGANVEWASFGEGERRWTNDAGGQFWATRIGGPGSFNPHHKSGKGKWEVRDDAAYCVQLDYGHMMIEGWCWTFFAANGRILMNMVPAVPGSKIRIYR